MNYPPLIQQLIDAGIAYVDMDGSVMLNTPLTGGGWGMNMPTIQIQNCGNTYITNNHITNNFYGDHAAVNDIHENNNSNIH